MLLHNQSNHSCTNANMTYPSANYYLKRKLHWMARRLRAINEPSTITEWIDAMMALVKVHDVISGNEDLSKPIKVWVKPEKSKETCLNFKAKTTATSGKKTKTGYVEERVLQDIGVRKIATDTEEAHTESIIPEQKREAAVIESPRKSKRSDNSTLISPCADDSDSNGSYANDSTHMEVEEGSLTLKTEKNSTWIPKLESIEQSTEQSWQEEALKFIRKDLERYSRLPKGGCRIYIERKTTEDVLGLLKERRRAITKDELHHILHDHVKRAVPNERYRRYNA